MITRDRLNNRSFMLILGSVAISLGIALLIAAWLIDSETARYAGAVCAGTGAIWLVCARWTNTDPMRTVERRYAREFFLAIGAYMAIMLLVWPMLEYAQGTTTRTLIALSPILPVLLIGRSVMRRIRGGDELEQRTFLEAAAIAGLITGVLSMSAGFFQAAGLLELQDGLLLVFPTLFIVYGPALWWTRRRYREE